MNAFPSGSRWYRDPTLFSLVSANLVTILLALTQQWDLATVVWVYWGQSVAYGLVCCLRILAGESSKEYAHGWLDSVARFAANAASTVFFLLHYGALSLHLRGCLDAVSGASIIKCVRANRFRCRGIFSASPWIVCVSSMGKTGNVANFFESLLPNPPHALLFGVCPGVSPSVAWISPDSSGCRRGDACARAPSPTKNARIKKDGLKPRQER